MAENSESDNGEEWGFRMESDSGIKESEVAAGAESISWGSTAETGGRRDSPRTRVNPFLVHQHSDDVPYRPPVTRVSTMQPGTAQTHSWRPSTQRLTAGDHRQESSVDTMLGTSVPQSSGPPGSADPVLTDRSSVSSPSTEQNSMASTALAELADSQSLISAVTEAISVGPSNTRTPSRPLLSIAASATARTDVPATSTSAAGSTLYTARDVSPPSEPSTPQPAVSREPRPDDPPSPSTSTAAAAPVAVFTLSSPSSSSSSPHHPSALSSGPPGLSPALPVSPPSSPGHLSSLHGAAGWQSGPVSSGDEDWERRPPAERWPPLGANDADDEADDGDFCLPDRRTSLGSADLSRLRKLEEEQEHLNNSLMALTTHFAQVQFRLRQIVEAPGEEKEQLLQELETFAFRGIPDVRQCKLTEHDEQELTNEWKHQELVETQRVKQRDLMQQLKTQLEDLEHYAYETGEAGLPSSVVLEKQRVIIDELKGKLNIDLNNLDEMTSEDLKSLVDCAVGQLINPLKMKEQLVNQLKTQVQDLERFISFLQGETEEGGCDGSCRLRGAPGAVSTSGDDSGAAGDSAGQRPRLRRRSARHRASKQQEAPDEPGSLMRRALTLLQLMTLTQFGCGTRHFASNQLKKTPRGNHWGDLRARLELSVSAVWELARASLREQEQLSDRGTDLDSDGHHSPPAAAGDRLTLAVRKELAVAIRDLMQHGLLQLSKSRSLVPFSGCLASRPAAPRLLHAWDLVLVYYRLKRGVQYNATPQRRLSQSFGLSVVGGTAITSKHTLLSAIGNIISSHTPLKRSADAHFKAFVCAGLNARKLSSWLRLILTTQAITEEYYQPWSYVVSTGFDDALQCVSRLEKLRFALPEDLAVRQLRNIRDAF